MRIVATYRLCECGSDPRPFFKDDEADRIFRMFGGQSLGRGMAVETRLRDIEYEVPDGLANAAAYALFAAGFKVDCP